MDHGLIVPLSPNEEIALRRVAYGSADIAVRYAERLMRLALVEDAADRAVEASDGAMTTAPAFPDIPHPFRYPSTDTFR